MAALTTLTSARGRLVTGDVCILRWAEQSGSGDHLKTACALIQSKWTIPSTAVATTPSPSPTMNSFCALGNNDTKWYKTFDNRMRSKNATIHAQDVNITLLMTTNQVVRNRFPGVMHIRHKHIVHMHRSTHNQSAVHFALFHSTIGNTMCRRLPAIAPEPMTTQCKVSYNDVSTRLIGLTNDDWLRMCHKRTFIAGIKPIQGDSRLSNNNCQQIEITILNTNENGSSNRCDEVHRESH